MAALFPSVFPSVVLSLAASLSRLLYDAKKDPPPVGSGSASSRMLLHHLLFQVAPRPGACPASPGQLSVVMIPRLASRRQRAETCLSVSRQPRSVPGGRAVSIDRRTRLWGSLPAASAALDCMAWVFTKAPQRLTPRSCPLRRFRRRSVHSRFGRLPLASDFAGIRRAA